MENASRRNRILMGVYSASWGMSMTAMAVVAMLEIFMLVYTFLNAPLYGGYIWRYRAFYIALLSVALAYMALNAYVRRSLERGYRWLKLANPLCAIFFFAWSLGITYSDLVVTGLVDATVFMTFSLTVPLSFYLVPGIYAAIAAVADALMIYLVWSASGSEGPIINVSIFFVFQFVLGISYLHLKLNVAERIVEEQENAVIDVMTGCPNRRAYEAEIKGLGEGAVPRDLAYVAIDMNGLKEVNDGYGHETGDRLIVGAAQCIARSFGTRGKVFRIGGDEFVALVNAEQGELSRLLDGYDRDTQAWAEANRLPLSTSHGCVCAAEFPGKTIIELARAADERMYAAKARYYQLNGRDRRKYMAKEG